MPGFTPAPTAGFVENEISSSVVSQGVDNTERNTAATTYTKVVAMRVPAGLVRGTAKVRFTLKSSHGSATVSGKIYKNGAEIGSGNNTSNLSYQTYDEDLDIGSAGDEIELYIKTNNASHAAYSNKLEILGDLDDIDTAWETVYP